MVTVKILQNSISYLSATVNLQLTIGKPEAATAVVAPDDRREDARNMLSFT
jgi:hypothetical protein